MTDDLDLVRRLRLCFTVQDDNEAAVITEAALRITALLDEIAALKREIDGPPGYKHQIATLHRCALEKATAEASRDALAGKLDTIHTAAILYIGGEADVSHDAATKLIERIATIARSAEE